MNRIRRFFERLNRWLDKTCIPEDDYDRYWEKLRREEREYLRRFYRVMANLPDEPENDAPLGAPWPDDILK